MAPPLRSWIAVACLIAVGAHALDYDTSDALKYDTSGPNAAVDKSVLRVHLVPHTHDDGGWLKTVDQYYYGLNQSIQAAGVQYILDGVVQALAANPDRRFVYAEMAFFSRWWAQQDGATRALVASLVEQGRLSFVNGGYVQHDEAAAHYVGMLDQTTRGHRFLARALRFVPTVGWQVDPFGHSGTQAGLFGAALGFSALFFGRADYQDMARRRARRELEVVWRGSGGGEAARAEGLFTGNFASGNYGPPPGFWWEYGLNVDDPIADDPRLEGYNVGERVDAFVGACLEVANATRGGDIMLTMGSDFHFGNAQAWFKNLDKLIHYANMDGRVHAFYSTPDAYVAAKHGYNATWPVKTDDFFPYADSPHAYWTGYFSSRPASKGYIRAATSFLQAARQLEAALGSDPGGPTTDALEEAVSLCQHHDAVTGTARQHVANDYHRRLHRGAREAQAVVTSALRRLLAGETIVPKGPHTSVLDAGAAAANTGVARRLRAAPTPRQAAPAAPALELCDWLNVTSCAPTVRLSRQQESMLVVVYNQLAWARAAPVRVPMFSAATAWAVQGPEGEAVEAQLVPASRRTRGLQRLLSDINATYAADSGAAELVFLAELPPLGYSSYVLTPLPEGSSAAAEGAALGGGGPQPPAAAEVVIQHDAAPLASDETSNATAGEPEPHPVVVDNGAVTLRFCPRSGLLQSAALRGGPAVALTPQFFWYNASDGLEAQEDRGQSSGAYIFRPNGVYPLPQAPAGAQGGAGAAVGLEVVRGAVVTEVRQTFAPWATLVTRLYKGQSHIEMEWTVGPIPFEDGLGREVVLRYSSGIRSGGAFFTDANGRAMVRRARDARPTWDLNVTEPQAGNFYPVTAAIYLQDEAAQLAVLTERAQGGASLRAGELELMVHRRTLVDDRRGVAEALNETACGCSACACPGLVARGVHWVALAPAGAPAAAAGRRALQQLLNDPPVLAFGGRASVQGQRLRRAWSLTGGRALQGAAHLLTLVRTEPRRLLLRLAHLLEAEELPDAAAAAAPAVEILDLGPLLRGLGCGDAPALEELSLSGNQRRGDAEVARRRFRGGEARRGADGGGGGAQVAPRAGTVSAAVELRPMEVRTFELEC